MIWVTNAEGVTTYMSPEWSQFTGQPQHEALDYGWQKCIHVDDRGTVARIFDTAVRARTSFTLCYRLHRHNDGYSWVVDGANPSICPNGKFLGYLGSVTEIEQDGVMGYAHGRVGEFRPPPPHVATMPNSALDCIADHLLLAYNLLKNTPEQPAVAHIRQAMFQVAFELARTTGRPLP